MSAKVVEGECPSIGGEGGSVKKRVGAWENTGILHSKCGDRIRINFTTKRGGLASPSGRGTKAETWGEAKTSEEGSSQSLKTTAKRERLALLFRKKTEFV